MSFRVFWSPLLPILLLLVARSVEAAAPPMVYRIPYRLSDTKHLVVRVKFNGKGPFNYLIDTGAPSLYLPPDIAEQAGVKADDDSFGVVDRLELEGGLALDKVRCRIEEPFQLRGMNALGLAGRRLDGIIGYELLAKFRLEIDLTQPKLLWTPLDFAPPPPQSLAEMSKTPVKTPAMFGMLDALTKFAMALIPRRPPDEIVPRGFFGIELAPSAASRTGGGALVRSVLPQGPAAQAGLAANDLITQVQLPATDDEPAPPWLRVQSAAEALNALAAVPPAAVVRFEVRRSQKKHWLAVTTSKGGL